MARVIGTLAASGDTQAPTQPQNLSATAINRQRVDLSWTASTDNVGVTGYQVFRDDSPLDTSATTTYSDTSVSASTAYTYTVVAFDAAGNNSIASASAGATTPANASPTWDTIADQTLIVGDSYSLNLNDVCDDADADTIEYSIFAGTLPSGLTLVGGIISGTPTTAGQNPTVTVRAFDGFDNVDTDIVYETFTADVTAPPVPTGLQAAAAGSTQINLTWNTSTDAAGTANEYVSGTQDYRVYRSTDQTNFSLRTTVTGTSYQDTSLSVATRYDYKVAARDVELNESAQSSAVNATTLSTSPDAFALADELARSSMPNVVWWHGFESVAELNAFRWMNGVGNDPNAAGPSASNARVLVGEGPCGTNCLEFIYPAGVSQPTTLWWRPTAPMNTGSGKAANDPAANGTLTVRTWNPSTSAATANFAFGWYGHATYANADPTHFDGNQIWFQVRVKADPRRITGGNEASGLRGGKFVWFTTAETANSLSGGEHVFWSHGHNGNQGTGRNYLRCYVHQTTGIGAFDPLDQEEPGTRIQPGSSVEEDWYYTNGWDTLLFNLRPGLLSTTSGANSSRLRVYAARDGETQYTKVWDQEYGISSYEARNGLQAVILSAYNNGFDFPQEFFHRYAHPKFSKSFIPCPAVHSTASAPLLTTAISLTAGQSSTTIGGNNATTGITAAAFGSIQWVNRFFYDHNRRQAFLLGKYADGQGGERHLIVYDVAANTWTSGAAFEIGGNEAGHVYESFAYDPGASQLYVGRWNDTSLYRWTNGDTLTNWLLTANYGLHWSQNGTPLNRPMAWHPNLFGVGDGGLVIWRNISQGSDCELLAWRRSDNQFYSITGSQFNASGDPNPGACEYVRYFDAVFASHANGNTYRVPAGNDGALGTPVQITNPPIACRHVGGGSTGGILIDDPRGLGGPYIIEKGNTASRVWKYINSAWSLRGYTHPFPNGSGSNVATDTDWCIASCYPTGGFMCMRDTTSGVGVRFWEPND